MVVAAGAFASKILVLHFTDFLYVMKENPTHWLSF